MPPTFVLASQSPARLETLIGAGIHPTVRVSGVDEDAVLDRAMASAVEGGYVLEPSDQVLVLARSKAEKVAAELTEHEPEAIVVGCDSMLEFEGAVVGKPGDHDTARDRWLAMRGRIGILHTGHWMIDQRQGASGATFGETSSTVVHFAELTDDEVEAYVESGEPLAVAGAFTVDGLGGPYIERIEGDYHAVRGISLPLLRRMLLEIGVPIHVLHTRD